MWDVGGDSSIFLASVIEHANFSLYEPEFELVTIVVEKTKAASEENFMLFTCNITDYEENVFFFPPNSLTHEHPDRLRPCLPGCAAPTAPACPRAATGHAAPTPAAPAFRPDRLRPRRFQLHRLRSRRF
ncbi:hypothetical protein PR202_gb01244 [Eleusine coracana subsp. coracana]|uniref:Uncharacterized protein n=1 Tax=Eleusine coracana subsp. coracana TaxID=191504 RepID=A0AAV5DW63_ELECO|nr:hypothetical protein PR202_gb01244 [Eleusine coracana subsp. coracana]